MGTYTMSPPESMNESQHERRERRRPKLQRMQVRGAVMVRRHALSSVAVSAGVGLAAGLAIGLLISSAVESRRPPENLFARSRKRMGNALSNVLSNCH